MFAKSFIRIKLCKTIHKYRGVYNQNYTRVISLKALWSVVGSKSIDIKFILMWLIVIFKNLKVFRDGGITE